MEPMFTEKTDHGFEGGVDPSAKIWPAYVSEVEKVDQALAQNCKGDMDSILIFAGLFSAVLTAFLMESYKQLKPDSEDTTVLLLAQISQQLLNNSNSMPLTIPTTTPPFKPSTASLICNVLWFLSLGFSLACALTATLVQRWARNYVQATEQRPAAYERGRIRAYLYKGLQKFGMTTVVEVIPMLLHISLFLFFAGLIQFLSPLNLLVGYLAYAIFTVSVIFYMCLTVLPVLYSDCPYHTPISVWCWNILRTIRRYRQGKYVGQETMAYKRDMDATRNSLERDERDRDVLSFTIESLHQRDGLLNFLHKLYSSEVADTVLLVQSLDDSRVRLGSRITELLSGATTLLGRIERERRISSCLNAISRLVPLRTRPRNSKKVWFGIATLQALSSIVHLMPKSIQLNEAAVKVFWGLIRDVIDLVVLLEKSLVEMNAVIGDSAGLTCLAQRLLDDEPLRDRIDDICEELTMGRYFSKSNLPSEFPWPGIASQLQTVWPHVSDFLATLQAALSGSASGLSPLRGSTVINNTLEKCRASLRMLHDARILLILDGADTGFGVINYEWEKMETATQLFKTPISIDVQRRLVSSLEGYKQPKHERKPSEAAEKKFQLVRRFTISLVNDRAVVEAALKCFDIHSKNEQEKLAISTLRGRLGVRSSVNS